MINLVHYIQKQIKWSKKVFGNPDAIEDYRFNPTGLCNHIRRELDEIEADPSDVYEWIDVIILALDGAWRSGSTPEQIIDALVDKQLVNRLRNWGEPDSDGVIEHIREGRG